MSGVDLGGRVWRTQPPSPPPPPPPPQGFDHLRTQRRVPLCTVLRYSFLVTDAKKFSKALFKGAFSLASIYISLRECAPKKSQFFHKVPQKNFFGMFFQNFGLRRRTIGQYRGFLVLWEGRDRKIIRVDRKKRSTKISTAVPVIFLGLTKNHKN